MVLENILDKFFILIKKIIKNKYIYLVENIFNFECDPSLA
jgi:hypothetical protein